MGLDPASWVAIAGLANSLVQGSSSKRMQTNAQNTANEQATRQEKLADEAMNAANKKKPDTNAIMAAAMQAAKTGGSSTMLTGPGGAPAGSLGSASLLGS